jgi:hypothetical protein
VPSTGHPEFTEAMLNICRHAKADARYEAKVSLGMVVERRTGSRPIPALCALCRTAVRPGNGDASI